MLFHSLSLKANNLLTYIKTYKYKVFLNFPLILNYTIYKNFCHLLASLVFLSVGVRSRLG